MARYYFDILDGAQIVRDDEGSEFDSPDAAVQAAVRAATEIGQGRLARGETSNVVIEVRDERSQRVCTIRASMEIDWHVSRAQGPHPWSAWWRKSADVKRNPAQSRVRVDGTGASKGLLINA